MNKVKQLSIFLENKSGRLAKVTETLSKAKINIHALSLADTSDFGILRLIVNDIERAKDLLKEAGLTVGTTDVIALEMPHSAGALNEILQLFSEYTINIEYMYAFVHKLDSAVLVFRCQNPEDAIKALVGKNYKVLTAEEVSKL